MVFSVKCFTSTWLTCILLFLIFFNYVNAGKINKMSTLVATKTNQTTITTTITTDGKNHSTSTTNAAEASTTFNAARAEAKDVTNADADVDAVADDTNDTTAGNDKDDDDDDKVIADKDNDYDDDDDDDKAEKNALQTNAASDAATSTSFTFWGAMRGLWNLFKDDISESIFGTDNTVAAAAATAGRTFGKIRRLQMALIPLMFKFGILTAMISFLVMLGLKTLFLLKILVLLNLVTLLAKFLTLKANLFEHHQTPIIAQPSWGGYTNGGWSEAPTGNHHHSGAPSKEIHLHIHGGNPHHQHIPYGYAGYPDSTNQQQQIGWQRRNSNDPYSAYEPVANYATNDVYYDNNELTNRGPFAAIPNYVTAQRYGRRR